LPTTHLTEGGPSSTDCAGPVLVDDSLAIFHAPGACESSHGLAKPNTHRPFFVTRVTKPSNALRPPAKHSLQKDQAPAVAQHIADFALATNRGS
jgi:hypothetical protein